MASLAHHHPIDFPPRECLVKTGPVDYADWNYRKGLLGAIQRQRFHLALDLLGQQYFDSLLEVGYGSGIFFKELAQHASELCGIDVHDRPEQVAQSLKALGIEANLATAPAESIPFETDRFDCAVAISALEFVKDIDQACEEIHRVLAPGGTFVVISPGASAIIDAAFRLLTGKDPRKDFGDRRQKVIPALKRHFRVERLIHWPPGPVPTLYRALRATK